MLVLQFFSEGAGSRPPLLAEEAPEQQVELVAFTAEAFTIWGVLSASPRVWFLEVHIVEVDLVAMLGLVLVDFLVVDGPMATLAMEGMALGFFPILRGASQKSSLTRASWRHLTWKLILRSRKYAEKKESRSRTSMTNLLPL